MRPSSGRHRTAVVLPALIVSSRGWNAGSGSGLLTSGGNTARAKFFADQNNTIKPWALNNYFEKSFASSRTCGFTTRLVWSNLSLFFGSGRLGTARIQTRKTDDLVAENPKWLIDDSTLSAVFTDSGSGLCTTLVVSFLRWP
jgi:hypothetical protein